MGSNIYIAASGAIARMRDLEVVANNLANSNTAGFKRDEPVFSAALQSYLLTQDGDRLPGLPARSYVRTDTVGTDYSAGAVMQTGGPLDVAIEGRGFFEVETPAGTFYTRAGAFAVNENEELSTLQGYSIVGIGGAIDLQGGSAQITPDGMVLGEDGAQLGQIKIVDFEDLRVLTKVGGNLFAAPPDAQARELASPRLVPGAVESSNVVSVREMTALMMIQRAFESNLAALRADDQATADLIQEIS